MLDFCKKKVKYYHTRSHPQHYEELKVILITIKKKKKKEKRKKVVLINNIRKQNPGMQSPELFKMRFCQRRRDDSRPTTVNAMS